MDAADFRRRIAQAWEFVNEELQIGRTTSSLQSLPINAEFNDVALNSNATYRDIYVRAVGLSYYNFMLDDYAIFQFSWQDAETWRLAYFPNPWISGVEDAARIIRHWEALESLGGLHQEELTNLIDELPYQAAIPHIRFEYAVGQYREIAHPVAHFHIGRDTSNRWALARPLDPLTFVMHVTRLYYSPAWNPLSSFHGGPEDNCLDRRFMVELNRMRLAHQFTDNERRSAHFTSQ